MFTCISKTVNAALGMNPCSALKRIPVIVGAGVAAILQQSPGHYITRPLGVNSSALTTGDSWLVTSQVHQCFHSILSHKICPKCQIAVVVPPPPSDWKVSWGPLLLFTCTWWKWQSVSSLGNLNSLSCSDLEIQMGFTRETPVQYGMCNVCAA